MPEKKITLVVFHANCLDGFGAAWCANQSMGDFADYHAHKHGDEYPDAEGYEEVMFLDMCPTTTHLVNLLAAGHRVAILDHHKTAIPTIQGVKHPNLHVVFDLHRSGVGIAWDSLIGPSDGSPEMPLVLQWIQDRDIWTWKVDGTETGTEGLYSYPFDFDTWSRLIKDPERLRKEGEVLVRLGNKQMDTLMDRVYFTKIDGLDIPTVNTDTHISKLLNRICKKYPDAPYAAAWFLRADGTCKYSLRSVGDFDVADVAAKHGGGGHKNAAGYLGDIPK